MKMRALAQAEVEKKLPWRESLRRVEAVRAIGPETYYAKRLATAKTLRRLCITLVAFAVTASLAFGQTMEHAREVNSAQFSRDGRRVVTTSKDYTARLWDATTGQAIGQPMQHHGSVVSARFSPDGRRVVTASEDNTARLWDATTGRAMGQPMQHDGPVVSAWFSPDSKRVVTASADKTARLWDAATGKALSEPMQHPREVNSAQFSPDGRWIVTTSKDYTVLPHIFEKVFLAPSGEHCSGDLAQIRAVIGADDRVLESFFGQMTHFTHPELIGELEAAFGHFHGDLFPIDQADLAGPEFLRSPKLACKLAIGQDRNALLFHLGEEIRRVAFPVEDDCKPA